MPREMSPKRGTPFVQGLLEDHLPLALRPSGNQPVPVRALPDSLRTIPRRPLPDPTGRRSLRRYLVHPHRNQRPTSRNNHDGAFHIDHISVPPHATKRILFFGAVDYIRDDCEIEAWMISPSLDPAIVRVPGLGGADPLSTTRRPRDPARRWRDVPAKPPAAIVGSKNGPPRYAIIAVLSDLFCWERRKLRFRQDRLVLCVRQFCRNSERVDPGLQSSQIGPQLRRGGTPDYFVERAFEPLEDPCNETCVKQHR